MQSHTKIIGFIIWFLPFSLVYLLFFLTSFKKDVSHLFLCFLMNNVPLVKDIPASIYLFKVNNRNTRERCEFCSKSTIKTLERRQWHILGSLLLIFKNFTPFSTVFNVDSELVNFCWNLTYVNTRKQGNYWSRLKENFFCDRKPTLLF